MEIKPIFPRGNTPIERMTDLFMRIIPDFLGMLPMGTNFFVVMPGGLGFMTEVSAATFRYLIKVCRVSDVTPLGIVAEKPHIEITYSKHEHDALDQALKLLNVDPDECVMGCGGPSVPYDNQLRSNLN